MSGGAPAAPARATRLVLITRGWRVGLVVGISSALLFTLVGNRLVNHNYVLPDILQVWSSSDQTTQLGGQWTSQLFITLVRLVPSSSVHSLTVLTILGGAFIQGFIAHDLVKRGWPPVIVAFTLCLTTLHPVILYLATNGSPMLLYVILASFAIIALDRLEAIGDTQSFIVLGLVISLHP